MSKLSHASPSLKDRAMDIRIETENGVFYFPITTCVIISVVLSLILLWLFGDLCG